MVAAFAPPAALRHSASTVAVSRARARAAPRAVPPRACAAPAAADGGAAAEAAAADGATAAAATLASLFDGPPWGSPDFSAAPAERFGTCGVDVADGMDFFRAREGTWASWRVTHHLAFRRAESGESEITMQCLEAGDERIVKLLDDNGIPREAAVGGCYVTWKATMQWDQEGENHEGSTVFALVPDADDKRRGRIVRDRGYAEIVPIAGKYYLDAEDALCLDTPYDGGAVEERFMFDGPNLLHRVSTVRRFGGLSNATFATETRLTTADGTPVVDTDDVTLTDEEVETIVSGDLFLFGGRAHDPSKQRLDADSAASTEQGGGLGGASAKRMADAAAAARKGAVARPSPGSAFSTGFSARPAAPTPTPTPKTTPAERKAGIDLSKVPPSMRADFERSLGVNGEEPADDGSSP